MDKIFKSKVCDRCGGALNLRILSRMNMDVLCMSCAEEERKHPYYKEAAKKEAFEAARGNTNYQGLYAGEKYPFGVGMGK